MARMVPPNEGIPLNTCTDINDIEGYRGVDSRSNGSNVVFDLT